MIAEKKYLSPVTVTEALRMAGEQEGSFRFLAGGTDVLVNKFQGNDTAACLIDLSGIEELRKIETDESVVKIGALVRLEELQKNKIINRLFPALSIAAGAVASPMLRKTATLGGNLLCENRCIFYNQSEWWRESVGYCLKCDGSICIATGGKKNCFSKFVSDTAPVLISMDAKIGLIRDGKSVVIPLEEIYSGDGVNSRNLPDTAILVNIQLPLAPDFACAFRKLRPREAVDFTSLTTAVSLSADGKIKIVLGGVDPAPVIIEGKKEDDLQLLISKAVKKARIVDNDYYSRLYRKEMIGVFLARSFRELELK